MLTDGRVADPDGAVRTAAASIGRAADAVRVIDTEDGPVRLGLAGDLAKAAHRELHALRAAAAGRLTRPPIGRARMASGGQA